MNRSAEELMSQLRTMGYGACDEAADRIGTLRDDFEELEASTAGCLIERDELLDKVHDLQAERDNLRSMWEDARDALREARAERDTLAEMVRAAAMRVGQYDSGALILAANGSVATSLTPDQAERFSAALTRLREETPNGE